MEAPHTRICPPQGSSIGTIHGGHQKLEPGLPSQRVRRPGTRQAGGPLCASLQGRALAPSPPSSLPPHPQPVLRAPLGRGGHREFGRGGLTLRLQWRSPPWLRAPPRNSRAQSCPVQLPRCTSWAGWGSLAVDSFLPPAACSPRSRIEGDRAWGLPWRGQPLSGPATARAPHEPTAPLPSGPLSRQGGPSRGRTPVPGWSPTPRGPRA